MNTLKNTTLNVGLISTPVKIMNATSKIGHIHFSFVGPDGQPVERVYRDVETEDIVAYEDLKKAYEGKVIDSEDLSNIEEACLTDGQNDLTQINISFFLPLKDLPMDRVEGVYYIAPNRKTASSEPLFYFAQGLKQTKTAAIAKVVIKNRQKLLAIFYDDGALKAVSLQFQQSMVSPDQEVLIEGKSNKGVAKIVKELIDTSMGSIGDLNAMEDSFVVAKQQMVNDLVFKGSKPTKPKKSPKNASKDLMEALEASVAMNKKKAVSA